ncbi:hypothetical protein O3M35_009123 [Rhynocoris fuscipes]|uniref:Uncharacterized protein n=1 Tax=Rhynocoris fuscipes TaxID=488301 RepID=A0AAW1D7Q9_9HEMI
MFERTHTHISTSQHTHTHTHPHTHTHTHTHTHVPFNIYIYNLETRRRIHSKHAKLEQYCQTEYFYKYSCKHIFLYTIFVLLYLVIYLSVG